MLATLNAMQFGAVADGTTLCTEALQRGIDACGHQGGGTLYIPAGKYLTGTLWMRSNVTLELDAGAILLGAMDINAFPVWHSAWEGPSSPAHAALITGEGLHNVTLKGRGTINGSGPFWWDLFNREKLTYTRPNLIRLIDCRDVLIDGLTFTQSPRWTLNPVACENVTITSVTIRNPDDSPNTDGINPDSCSNVHISNCQIDVGDDCIAIKSGSIEDQRPNPRPCQNITVSNCTMLHGHGGIVIGSETSGGVRNVTISNCIFSGTERGIRLKSRRGRGGVVEDICADNIVMDDVLCPIVVNLYYVCGASEHDEIFSTSHLPIDDLTPRIRRLRFNNLTVRRAKFAAAYIRGLPEMFVDDLSIDGLSIYMDSTNTLAGQPAMAVGCKDMCRAGFVLENVSNIKLRRVDLYDQLGPALMANNSRDIFIGDLHASENEAEALVVIDGIKSKIEEVVARLSDSVAIPDAELGLTYRGPRKTLRRSGFEVGGS